MKPAGTLLPGLLVLLTHEWAAAQVATEKVLVQKAGVVEEFSVLKTDKTVRQGAYIRYRPLGALAGVAVLEAGNYEHGLKEGEWRTFYEQYPWNKLLSKGTYHAGLPDGLWQYYHCYWAKDHRTVREAVNGRKTKAGVLVSLTDTTALLQAKGMNYNGVRVGVWTYYDTQHHIIQQVNQANGHLVYWQSVLPQPLSGNALAAAHPLLYLGGKGQLLEAIHHGLNANAVLDSRESGSPEFLFHVDATGHQTHVALAANVLPNQLEAAILASLNNLDTHWLPQMVGGRPVPATYSVRITVTHNDADNALVQVKPLGE